MKQLATATATENIQLVSDRYECFTHECIGQDDFYSRKNHRMMIQALRISRTATATILLVFLTT